MARLPHLIFVIVVALSSTACSTYVGTKREGYRISKPRSRSLTDRVGGVEFVLSTSNDKAVIYSKDYLTYNPWTDATLFKLWGFAPVTLVYSIGDAIYKGKLTPLKENIVGDLVDRLAGGVGWGHHMYHYDYKPSYGQSLLDWTNWFNPFRAHFVGWKQYHEEYYLEAVPSEKKDKKLSR